MARATRRTLQPATSTTLGRTSKSSYQRGISELAQSIRPRRLILARSGARTSQLASRSPSRSWSTRASPLTNNTTIMSSARRRACPISRTRPRFQRTRHSHRRRSWSRIGTRRPSCDHNRHFCRLPTMPGTAAQQHPEGTF